MSALDGATGGHHSATARAHRADHASEMATAAPIHPSLVRPLLYLGVERHVIALEATIALALIVGVGLHLITVALVAFVALAVHPALVWATARDSLATEIFVRARRYADYYAPHASIHGAARAPRPSIPNAR